MEGAKFFDDYSNEYFDEYNRLPIARLCCNDERIWHEEATDAYMDELKSMGIGSLEEAENFFNSRAVFMRFKHLIAHCLKTHSVQTKDFVTNNFYCSIKLQCERDFSDPKLIICRAVMFNISKYEPKTNVEDRERLLRSLYTLYDYINFVDANKMEIKRLYTSNSATFVDNEMSYMAYTNIIANKFIHPEEVDKYLEFVKPENIKKRFENESKSFVISYFRLKNINDEYEWKTFIIIQPTGFGEGQYLSCMRNVDSNTEHILIKKDYVRLFNDLPLAYAVFQLTGTNENNLEKVECIYASNKLAAVIGKEAGDVVGMDISGYLSRPVLKTIKKMLCQAAFEGKDGRTFYYASSLKKWFNIVVNQAVSKGRCAVIFEDVTKEKTKTERYNLGWRTDDLIINCTKTLHSGLPYETAINKLLELIGNAVGADRLYILEKQSDGTFTQAFEWCNGFVPEMKEQLAVVDENNDLNWKSEFPGAFSLVIEDAQNIKSSHPGLYERLTERKVRSIIEFPIEDDGQIIGNFGVVNFSKSINLDVAQLMESVSYFLSSEFSRKRLLQELEKKSVYDGLCDVKNRSAMEITTKKLKKRDVSVGIIYADANGLKTINDTKGHEAGDELLKNITTIMKEHFNKDSVYRVGGDEFVVVVYNVEKNDFFKSCISLKEDYEKTENLSVAIGWEWGASSIELDEVMKAADKKMYEDKSNYYKMHNRRRSVDR